MVSRKVGKHPPRSGTPPRTAPLPAAAPLPARASLPRNPPHLLYHHGMRPSRGLTTRNWMTSPADAVP
jgi:hypothetical protein